MCFSTPKAPAVPPPVPPQGAAPLPPPPPIMMNADQLQQNQNSTKANADRTGRSSLLIPLNSLGGANTANPGLNIPA